MRTWDNVKYLYYNIAARYAKYDDIDALVNEAWIMTYPYINEPDYKLPHKIHRVIQLYIRNQTQKYRDNYSYRKVYFNSIDEFCENIGSSNLAFSDKNNHDLEDVDICDYFDEYVDKKLTSKEKILLYMYYDLGCTLEQIGRVFELTRERIRQIIKEIIQKVAFGD